MIHKNILKSEFRMKNHTFGSVTYLYRLLTYLLTPWSTVLEKLTGSHLVKQFPTFHGI